MRVLIPDLPEFRDIKIPGIEPAYYRADHLPDGDFVGVVAWGLPRALRSRVLARPGLKWVLTLTAGIDGWPDVLPPGTALYNAHELHDAAVAQHAAATLLAAGRGLIRFAQARHWERRTAESRPLWTLKGRQVVVWGYGHIGRELDRLLAPFGAHLTGLRSHSTPQEIGAALKEADDLVLLLPLTGATRQIVDHDVLQQLKPGAWLYNLGRGELVDPAALLAALDSNHLGGAVLDVTDPEPLPDGDPLWGRPNVLITPHIASTTDDMSQRAADYAAGVLAQLARGEEPQNKVELGKGY
ncbi:NAD(P)-dependent oxidoreductase [Deinococcus rubellus]|uniref:Hydroxyacid dehydrogenase n=1 Tax=Deinococcus rubellus TaxID=1889240 RepID=A0ABY5YFY9_9DEIO|nr:NAD(P)-dependent oxidoreductase [Deinococcus rubellus]UWX63963.1 hydroxyacid dehydrogenase [Deinococcus rubellus]